MSEARFTFSATEGRIEVVGSEEFVAERVKEFSDLIRDLLNKAPAVKPLNSHNAGNAGAGAGGGGGGKREFADYENVLAFSDNKVQILKPLPGANNAAKTVSAALLTLFGNGLLGTEEIPFSTIREVCQAHGCLDSGNFAGTLKDQKEYFIVSGSRANLTAKLTVPGQRAAEQLAKDLNVK